MGAENFWGSSNQLNKAIDLTTTGKILIFY